MTNLAFASKRLQMLKNPKTLLTTFLSLSQFVAVTKTSIFLFLSKLFLLKRIVLIPMNNPFNDPNIQQGMLFNPNFNSQNAQLGNLKNFHGLNPNLHPMAAPNNQLGLFQLVSVHLQSNPQLQINLLNQLQAQSFAAPFQLQGGCLPFVGFNPNQMMGMPNPQLFAQNQMFQANPMMGLLGNPQLVANNMGSGFGNAPGAMGPNPMYGSLGLMNSEQPMCSTPAQMQWNQNNGQQANESQQFQVDNVEAKSTDNACANSQYSAGGCSGKEPSHNRFQKSQLHDVRSSRGTMKQFNKRGGRAGQHNWRQLKSQPTNSWEETPTVSQRPLRVNYTKIEIQLWREARKKNFPTRANLNKKGRDNENNEDADAKLRRQQLKEVLAKQAELGVEVAEIPPSYLREPEDQAPEMGNEREVTDGRSTDRFNKKRGRGHGRDNRRSKRQNFLNKGAPASPPSVKREPSLLEKLLSADIKREKNRLLQVFRFMVLNDFFKQWPEKPLEFPIITVKDDGAIGGGTAGETGPALVRPDSPTDLAFKKAMAEGIVSQKESTVAAKIHTESDEDDTFCTNQTGNDIMGKADGTGEQFEESEEGEITD